MTNNNKKRNKLLKKYIILLRSGIPYNDLMDFIKYDYQVFLSKQSAILDGDFDKNTMNQIDSIKSIIKSDVDASNHIDALKKAYTYIYRAEEKFLQ